MRCADLIQTRIRKKGKPDETQIGVETAFIGDNRHNGRHARRGPARAARPRRYRRRGTRQGLAVGQQRLSMAAR